MKKTIYILLFIILSVAADSYLIENCFGQWVQMSYGIGKNNIVWSLASDGNNVFAGTSTGVYITTNNGNNWVPTSLINKYINVLFIDGNNIYAGTETGIFRSTNNGQNWTQIGISNRCIWALAVNGNNIFAGTVYGHGVYRSSNNGLTWIQTSLNSTDIGSLAFVGNNLIAGDWVSNSVFITANNGDNWTQINLGGTSLEIVMCLAVSGNDVFAGTNSGGIFHSTNGGINWSLTSYDNGSVLSLTIRDNFIFAGAGYACARYGVHLSTNNGLDWIDKSQGLDDVSIWSLATTSQHIYAGSDTGIYRRDFSEIISVKKLSEIVPAEFSLSQNYPNPFNPETKIRFTIPLWRGVGGRNTEGVGLVTLKIYDALGRKVETLVNEALQPGTYEVSFNGSGYNSGVYFYRLVTDGFTETKRMLLVK